MNFAKLHFGSFCLGWNQQSIGGYIERQTQCLLYKYLNQLMFLNKYKNKKRLGKGAYGDVYLVEDEKGTLLALKLISVKMIEAQPHLREYLDGEIECMKSMHSPYITKLFDVEEDQTNIYLVLQYCDGGDLINYQSKLPGKVFSIEKATEVLAEVINGLEELHKEGYLHRDIKSQNVLIKGQNGKQVFKLADFGFSKKKTDIGGTILGTEQFMSPEIFSGNQSSFYGFQVDMWAFGVLFYFMLNMEFPFKLNPHWQPERKEVQLRKIAKDFSYAAFAKGTKKQILTNCTPEIEDLFKKMFHLDPDLRITFSDIRKHPLFRKHFPVVQEASKILYSKKFQPSKIIKNTKTIASKPKNIEEGEDNIRGTISVLRKKDKKFPAEKEILEHKKDEIDFLKDNAQAFQEDTFLNVPQKLMLVYNLRKYYIVLLRKFKQSLNKNNLKELYPGLKWDQFTTTKEFKELAIEVEEDISKHQLEFESYYDKCAEELEKIEQLNSKFRSAFIPEVKEVEFQGEFKESYRKSTICIFGVLRQALKNKTSKGNKLNYILSILVISHAFNNIFSDLQNLRVIFKDYLDEKKKAVDKIDYSQLRMWMTNSKENVLNNIAKSIIKIYFGA